MQKTVSAAQKAKKPKPQKTKVIKAQDPHLPKPLQTLNLEPNFYALMTRIRLGVYYRNQNYDLGTLYGFEASKQCRA